MNKIQSILLSVFAFSTTFGFAQSDYESYSQWFAGYARVSSCLFVDANPGFTLGFSRYSNVTKESQPLFVQWGIEMERTSRKGHLDGFKVDESQYSVLFPANAVYGIGYGQKWGLEAFAGLNVRINLKARYSYSIEGINPATGSPYIEQEVNLSKDCYNHTFQIGLNLGGTVRFGAVSLSYKYTPYLTKYINADRLNKDLGGKRYKDVLAPKYTDVTGHYVTVGYRM